MRSLAPTLMRILSILFFTGLFCSYSYISSDDSANETKLIDYKSERYKLYVGEHFEKQSKDVFWLWAGEGDPDGRIDSAGKDVFMYLGEPLLKYNRGEYLPALFISTERNRVTQFACSMLFDLEDTTVEASRHFLELMSKDIVQLKEEKIKRSLIYKGIFVREDGNFVETFRLVKGQEYENDKFSYTVKLKAN